MEPVAKDPGPAVAFVPLVLAPVDGGLVVRSAAVSMRVPVEAAS
jgi:hypothetical protein